MGYLKSPYCALFYSYINNSPWCSESCARRCFWAISLFFIAFVKEKEFQIWVQDIDNFDDGNNGLIHW